MNTTQSLIASGIATSPNAIAIIDNICARLADHLTVTRSADSTTLVALNGSVELTLRDSAIAVAIDCTDASTLFSFRSMVADQLHHAADGAAVEITWNDGSQASAVPNLYEVTVVTARNLTPHMRRVTVRTDRPDDFVAGGLHVRLLIPPRGRAPVWPHVEADGRICWPKDDDALIIRAYTIRNVDRTRGELDIDFVIHEGSDTPGASWSMNAQSGDRIALMGPGGGDVPEATELLLAGDETALPAIARIAETAAPHAKIRIVLEVEDEKDEQPLPSKAQCAVTWLHRKGRQAGTTGALVDAVCETVRQTACPCYVWVACEQSEARCIRNFMRNESGYQRNDFSVAAYWQREQA